MKQVLIVLCFTTSHIYAQNLLESEEWIQFFADKSYEQKALEINDESFWEYDEKYTYYTNYPLLLIYQDGNSEIIHWQYDGLNNLIHKKHTLLDENFERIQKENLVYIVFDGLLLKNPLVGNMVDGDFMIVYKRGPMSVYREFYTSPVERGSVESAMAIYHLSKPVENFYLGSFEKKAAKLVGDYPRLAKKIKDKIIGYSHSDDDLIRIAEEYNAWVEENYPYRFEEHTDMFWNSRF